jgi:bisphosphoglycerate-independent phosphoglycerate mutase (AlkP superfamily)
MEKVARAADKEISRIVKYVMEIGGGIVLTSPHAPIDAAPRSFSCSNGPVPFSLVAQDRTKNLLATATGYYAKSGYLADMILSRRSIADIAPTVLDLLRIPKPVAMTGQSLLTVLR